MGKKRVLLKNSIYQNLKVNIIKNNLLNKENIVYFIGVTILLIYFLINFFSLPDISNPYISTKAFWIFNLEVVTNVFLFALVAYLGYNYVHDQTKSFDKYLMILAFICIIIIHLLAFNPAVDHGGDNGNYIYAAKSLATLGNTYHLPRPNLPLDRIVVGYPLILSGIYLIFGGINILAFKITTMILSLFSVFFYYLIMKMLVRNQMAIILTILYGIHSFIVSYSSMIMTETPTLFWEILTWYLLLKYEKGKDINYKILILLVISSIFTYLTRNIGVTLLVAINIYLFSRTRVIDFFLKKRKFEFEVLPFKKLVFYLSATIVLFLLIQLRGYLFFGESDTNIFFKTDWFEKLSNSFYVIISVFSENLFCSFIIRWISFPYIVFKIILSVVMLVGLIIGISKKEFYSIYIILFLITLMVVTPVDNNSLVLSRYTIPLIPFYLFIFYEGVNFLFIKLYNFKKIFLLLSLFLLVLSSFSGNGYLVQRSHIGQKYPPALASYFDCAKWINENLPSNVLVESRKSRIFFVFSESYSISHVSGGTAYDLEFEKNIMKLVKSGELNYLVLDSFSGASSRCYVPLLNKYPQIFKLYKVFGDKYPCYLFKIEK